MNNILHKTTAAAELGGEFISSKNVSKQPDADSKGSLVAGMFSSSSNALKRPDDFVVDINDLQKPAVWNKNDFGRTIKLTED